ncbi:transporter substrate-binding domain-containing protein [Desulfobotulus mexicanus]|uniref:Transporter substrate-binding domain-containing protein n=1 Tax=Desulfobotulus mexicanus TaxID=2586642 RepID=A0A5S5MDK3_9BACT|nr:transporter substrate-binding domain-containing protein [Desulfobotulus mexicanus]TYT73787.1 transporter substrate-binding domain-containing protein [Desulfobotulus mexicanus]
MRRVLLVMFTIFFIAMPCFAGGVVSMASDPWPPFADPAHPHGGLSVEIAKAAFGTQGYTVTMEFMPWARVIQTVSLGELDLVAGAWMSDERKENFMFSEPFLINEIRFIKRKGDPFKYSGLETLPGLKVGVIRSYSYSDEFMNYPGVIIEPVNNFITNIRKLVAGRIDLTLEDEIVGMNSLSILDPALAGNIEFTGPSLASKPLYVLSGLKNPRHKEIIEAFNKGLKEIKANGTYDRIMASYGMKQL